jgi:hypothetical protein
VIEMNESARAIVGYLPKRLDTNRWVIVTTRSRDIGEALAHREPCIESVAYFLVRVEWKVRYINTRAYP